jgi:hypothetical protein
LATLVRPMPPLLFSKSENSLYTNHTTRNIEYFQFSKIAIYRSSPILFFECIEFGHKNDLFFVIGLLSHFAQGTACDIAKFGAKKNFEIFFSRADLFPKFADSEVILQSCSQSIDGFGSNAVHAIAVELIAKFLMLCDS